MQGFKFIFLNVVKVSIWDVNMLLIRLMKLSNESSLLIANDEDAWAANKENHQSTESTRTKNYILLYHRHTLINMKMIITSIICMGNNSHIGSLHCPGFCLMHTSSKDNGDNNPPFNSISLWNAKKEVRVSLLDLFCPKLYFLEGSRQNMAVTK